MSEVCSDCVGTLYCGPPTFTSILKNVFMLMFVADPSNFYCVLPIFHSNQRRELLYFVYFLRNKNSDHHQSPGWESRDSVWSVSQVCLSGLSLRSVSQVCLSPLSLLAEGEKFRLARTFSSLLAGTGCNIDS